MAKVCKLQVEMTRKHTLNIAYTLPVANDQ